MDSPSVVGWYASVFQELVSQFSSFVRLDDLTYGFMSGSDDATAVGGRPVTSSWVARCRLLAAWSALGATAGLVAAPSATAQSTIPDPVLAPAPTVSATLPGRPGEQVITPDWLLHHAVDRSGGVARLFWLADNRRVLYERHPAPGAARRLEVVDVEVINLNPVQGRLVMLGASVDVR
jgi:hypothetical protein